MYKYILGICLLFCSYLNAQVVSINPAEEFQGQTVAVIIKCTPGVIQAANPPADSFDVYLRQGATRINCDNFTPAQIFPGTQPYTDSLSADFTIPAAAIPGWYEVHVTTYTAAMVPVDNILANGFVVRIPGSCDLPFNVQDSAVTATSATVYWSPSVVADTFRVRWREFGTVNYFYKDVDGAGGISGTTITNLLPGAKYAFDVSTICSGIHSTYSLPLDTFTTGAQPVNCVKPYSLSFSSVTNTSVTIGWNNNVVSDTFRIRYRITGGGAFLYRNVNGSQHSVTINNLQPATSYDFQLSSVCSGNGTGYTNVSVVNTLSNPVACIVPFGTSASLITSTGATVSWSVNVTADTFRIRYKPVGGGSFSYKDVAGGGANNAALSGLLPNTQYVFQVSSICTGVSTAYSSNQNFTTLSASVNCVIPFNVSSSSVTNTSALISWSNLLTADTFRVRYSVNNTTNYIYKDVDGSAGSSTTISGLIPNTTYQFQVSSKCSGSGSGYCASQTFTTTNTAVNCTAVPFGLSSSNITNASATLSWSNLVTADSFLVRYSVNGTTNYIWKMVAGHSTTITGLSPVTTYQWQVRTKCNGAQPTAYSASVTFGTPLRLASTGGENVFALYPNPSSGNFTVLFTSEFTQPARISVTDLSGRIVYSKMFSVVQGENNIQMQLSDFSAGVYLFEINGSNVNLHRRITIESN